MGQRNLSPVKNCSRGQRNLMPAASALPSSPTDQFVCLPVSASSADEAIGPTTRGQILLAGFFSSEVSLKLERLRKRWPRHA